MRAVAAVQVKFVVTVQVTVDVPSDDKWDARRRAVASALKATTVASEADGCAIFGAAYVSVSAVDPSDEPE